MNKIQIALIIFVLALPVAALAAIGDCVPKLTITKVSYTGEQNNKDNFLVDYQVSTEPTCQAAEALKLRFVITRKGGKVEEKINEGIRPTSGTQLVRIDRGVLERDPETYSATLFVTSWRMAVAPKSTKVSTSPQLTQSLDQNFPCCVKITNVTVQSITPAPANKDSVKVNWTLVPGQPSHCGQVTGILVTVNTQHQDRSRCSGSELVTDPKAIEKIINAQCGAEPLGNPGPVTTIEAIVQPQLKTVFLNVSSFPKNGTF